MINLEVKMTENKRIIDCLELAQRVVEQANIKEEYRQIAFQKAFDFLVGSNDQAPKMEEAKPNIHITKTIAGFLRGSSSKSHADKVLTMAYFFLKNNKVAFTKEDIEQAYQEAFLPESKNINVEINGLIKRGFLMSTKEKIEGKKCFKITIDGITYYEEELSKDEKR